ncbi:MAG TPA: hypothetical protein PLY70_10190 [Saprospiraceae bacterium]|nr:hypothetical protein [Saprospiraceae bacterium]HPN69574.1 hypothetical protein [Saprospiraceae bacterium]
MIEKNKKERQILSQEIPESFDHSSLHNPESDRAIANEKIILIEGATSQKEAFSIIQLFAGIKEDNIHNEINWGQTIGNEYW